MQVGIAALGALYGTGCLLPQEDTVLEPLILKNRPPRIVEETANVNSVFKLHAFTVGNGPECHLIFEAFAEDLDIDDSPIARWYVDFDASPLERQVPIKEDVLLPNGQAQRGPTKLTILDVANSARFQVGTHVVTLMVFDGDLGTFDGPGSIPPADPIPGVDGGNPHFSTTYDWFITVDPAEPCTP